MKRHQNRNYNFSGVSVLHTTSLTYQRGKFTGPLIHTDLSLCAVYVIVDHRLDLNPLLDPHNDTEDVI